MRPGITPTRARLENRHWRVRARATRLSAAHASLSRITLAARRALCVISHKRARHRQPPIHLSAAGGRVTSGGLGSTGHWLVAVSGERVTAHISYAHIVSACPRRNHARGINRRCGLLWSEIAKDDPRSYLIILSIAYATPAALDRQAACLQRAHFYGGFTHAHVFDRHYSC